MTSAAPTPDVYPPDQTAPRRDLGDGLRARVDELERQLAAVLALCDRAELAESGPGRSSHAAFIRHTAISGGDRTGAAVTARDWRATTGCAMGLAALLLLGLDVWEGWRRG